MKGAALPMHDYFKTPLGNIPLDKQKISELMDNQLFKQDNKPFVKEHSIEVQLPFLQKVLKNFKIVPVVYGQVEPQQLADALSVFLDDEKTLLIFSADLSHYYKAEDAEVIDAHTARMIDLGNANLDKEMSCGAEGINAALILAKKMQMHAKLLDITHSGNVSGDLDRLSAMVPGLLEKRRRPRRKKRLWRRKSKILKLLPIFMVRIYLKLPDKVCGRRLTANVSAFPAKIIPMFCLTRGHRLLP